MSVPGIPLNTSSLEETSQDSLRRLYVLIDKMCLCLTKSQERIQTMLKSMIALNHNFKLQMQPQEVSGSDISLFKSTYRNIFVSTDLATDISDGLDTVHGIYLVFYEPSNIDPHTSHPWTQTWFVISLSCDLKPEIPKPTSIKIVVSVDLAPDLSVGIDSGWVIDWFFHEPFLLNSVCHYFEKVDEGQKTISQLWLSMSGDLNYVSSRYAFILSFVSLTKCAGQKLNNLMWLRMAG